MKNVVFVPTTKFLSRQNQASLFHTQAPHIQHLRNCNNFDSATSLHSNLLKSGFLIQTFTANHLLNCYVRLRRIEYARKLFDEMSEPNVVSFTSLIGGYLEAGQPRMGLWLFGKMPSCSVMPNEFTFATVIKACSILADVRIGREIHAQVQVLGFHYNVVVCSSLVDMYGKCNDVEGARLVFDLMDRRNIVSWTSMIITYAQNARGHEALQIFREFSFSNLERPNHFMLASVVNACSSLGKLVSGKVAHGAVVRGGYDWRDVVASALVDMYAKCGCFDYSDKIFRRIPSPSVVAYTSMIVSAAKYGLGELSLQLFSEMINRRIKPNEVTFLGILHACSHSGLIDDGLKHLRSMFEEHGILPGAKHYTCVVDMLGRTGRLEEAYELAKSIRENYIDKALLWGTLLSASRLHGRVDIAVEASKQLIDSNQQVAGAYVTLSNAYAVAGEWDNVHSVRSKMKRNQVYKEPGCSWVEIKDSTYVFYAGNLSSCEQETAVVNLLRELEKRMKERGYVGGSNELVFVDVEEEAKQEIVGLHSERLALGFGLINIPKGVTIRIMKNLRMCRDCHEAFKLISEIVGRDIVVRDINRFHHFKNGSCICRDFW
ncbi:hypothetical protein UlMin_009541 [Ulmus minor]